jgi:hypothetical protein
VSRNGTGATVVAALATVVLVLLLVTAGAGPSSAPMLPGAGPMAPVPPRAQPSRPPLPVDHWRALFDADVAAANADSERLSRSADSWDFYSLSYSLDEQASMFAATGDYAYARQGLRYATNMIASAQLSSSMPTSSFRDDYLGWVSEANAGDETPLYESYVWRYVTRLLRVLQPALAEAPPDVRADAAAVLAFTETDIVEKWLSRGADEHVYRSRTHLAAHWALIALDVSRLTDEDALRARCLEVVANVDDHLPDYGSSLRRQLRPHPGDPAAYWWSDVWGSTALLGQDVSHGNGVLAYVVESRDLDAGWTADDVARFSLTLTEFVLRPPGDHPAYVDGSGEDNGWIADGWVKLGRYDPAVQELLETYPVQNTQYYAAMAENAHVLGGRVN